MPTTVNFTSLVADVTNYIERGGTALTDPTVNAQIPRIINSAERKLAQVLKLQGQIEVLVGSAPRGGLQSGNPVLAKPDRWRQTVSINYGTGAGQNTRTQLYPRSLEYCRVYWPNQALLDPANPPAFYADYDLKHWWISPTPDQNYPAEFICYMQPQLLDDETQVNFWTNLTPNALLYGCLIEAEAFIKEDARNPLWTALWQQEIQTLNDQDSQKILDRSAQRKRP